MAELQVLSPEWWVTRLSAKLDKRNERTRLLTDYYTGNHPLPFVDGKSIEAYKTLQAKCRSNWCGLVADAVGERLNVEGFRLAGETLANEEIWRVWQANSLDAEFDHVIAEALSTRYGYMLVWPNEDDPETPYITPEASDQVIVEYVPGNRHVRAAALKVWYDDWFGTKNATLYLPDAVYKFTQVSDSKGDRWVPRAVEGETFPLVNPMGIVPIVEFLNRPNLRGEGLAEFEDVIDIQERVNETLLNRMIAVRAAAFKQKWVTGLEVPEDENGNPIQPFKSDVTAVWLSENVDTKFGEFSESDISGYLSSVEADIQHLAAITRTPPHYLLGQSGNFPSGDSLKSTETALVAKTRSHMKYFGESIEEVIVLAFLVKGVALGDGGARLETIWRDPESRSVGELTDAVLKEKALDVPRDVLWAKLGYSPTAIADMKSQLEEQIASGMSALVGNVLDAEAGE